MAKDRDCGQPLRGPFSFYDQSMCAWKTSQLCLDGEWSEFWETWPRAGMTRSGKAYELPTLARRTAENESGLLPAPTVQDAENDGGPSQFFRHTVPLNSFVKLFPTPRVCAGLRSSGMNRTEFYRKFWATPSATDGSRGADYNRPNRTNGGRDLVTDVGGQLNPAWVCWLMGYPSDWMDLPSSGRKSRQSRASRKASKAE